MSSPSHDELTAAAGGAQGSVKDRDRAPHAGRRDLLLLAVRCILAALGLGLLAVLLQTGDAPIPGKRPELVEPQWHLISTHGTTNLATRANAHAADEGPTPHTAPVPAASAIPAAEVTARPGDNIWCLTENHLSGSLGRPVTPTEVAPYWLRVIEANRQRFVDPSNPDLIYAGQTFVLPAISTAGSTETAAPPVPTAAPPGPAAPTASPQPEPATTSTTTTATTTTPAMAEPDTPSSSSHPPSTPATEAHDAHPAPPERSEPGPTLTNVLISLALSGCVAVLGLRALTRRRRPPTPITTEGTHRTDRGETKPATPIASDEAVARARRAAAACRDHLSGRPGPVSVTGFVVRANGDVAIHLSEPTIPVEPFTRDTNSDPSVWLMPDDQLPPPDQRAPAPQTLVILGHTPTGDWVLVDLETLGAVWIDGDSDRTKQLARSLLTDLATQTDHQALQLTAVGDIDIPQAIAPRITAVDHLDEDTTRLIQQLASDPADPLTHQDPTRPVNARPDAPRGGSIPSVFGIGPGADPVLLDRAARAATQGSPGLVIVALDPLEAPATQLIADSNGTLQLPHLDLTVHATGLTPQAPQPADDLVQHDLEPSEPTTARPHTTRDRTAANTDPNDAAGPYDEPRWERIVRIFADHRVETPDGTTISFRRGHNAAVSSRNARRGPELIAYLALRPNRSATLHQIAEHLWWGRRISDRTVHNFVSGTRRALGGTKYLSHADSDDRRYTLADNVVTDHQLLDHALDYARSVAQTAPGLALAALRPQLERIKAPAFRSHRLGDGLVEWASTHRVIDRIEHTVIEAALLAADLYATQPDGSDLLNARWAINQALKACPASETLTRTAMQLEAQAGRPQAAARHYQALTAQLAQDGLEPDDETTGLHRRITQHHVMVGG